jgi:hypothetical protein
VLDPQKNQCVAMAGIEPVVPEPTATVVATATTSTPIVATASASVAVPIVSASVATTAAPPPLPPPASGFAVDVRCTFTHGWVALLPAGKYPKDESFLMQSLIGLTKEPSFWSGTEYRALAPFAAKRCGASAYTRLAAPAVGSYFLLAGKEGTFDANGAYDKNGVKRQMTVSASTTVTLTPTDLTHTWLCISCPWIVFRGADGRDLEPFVVLANRRGASALGTDAHRVAHVPVHDGRITLRVIEVEDELTHLNALTLRVGDRELHAAAFDRALEIDRGKQVTLTYAVPNATDFVDVDVLATGYYDPK